jgi:hypothetical protein
VAQGGFVNPNAANGILDPPRGQPVDWSTYRPILLFGEFQPNMRSQYSTQYNFTIQRELSRDLSLQFGYVGSQGHRLLATTDLNRSTPQSCLDVITLANLDPANVSSFGSPGSCGPFEEDNQFTVNVPEGFQFHMPNGTIKQGAVGGTTLNFVGLRPFSSPNCDAFTGNKRFSHGLQAQVAYTWSKSIDQASSFEDLLNPFNPRATRSLSLFDARHRFVVNYYWDLPIPKHQGFAGKVLNGWALSGITQFQSGFPIHIQSGDDQELTSSIDFSASGVPDVVAPFHRLDPRKNDSLGFDPNSFQLAELGKFGNASRTICCGSGLDNWDVSLQKTTPLNENMRVEFRVDFFNLFNHTKFFNPDGNITDGSDFGRVTRAADPRLVQFALKFYF